MIPPLSICLRFWSPWSPVWRHRYIHNVYTNTRKVLPRLPGSTHARTHAGARIATTNALTLSRAVLLRTRCQVRRGGGGVFSIRKVSSGPRLLPTAVWNPLRVRTVLRYSEMELLLETRDTRFLNFFEDSKEGEVEGGRILLWWINLKKR